jgi:SPP1 gp7 family putative phage head morphogenesis protein
MRSVTAIAELKRIEARGVMASRAMLPRLRKEVLADYKAHRRIEFRHLLKGKLADLLRDAMLVAFLTGVKQSRQAAPGLQLSVFDSSLKELARLQSYDLGELRNAYGRDVATVFEKMGVHAESKLNATVTELLASGAHVREGTQKLSEAFTALGMGPQKTWQIESVFRTQVATAYGAGRWEADQDPAIQEILWGYEYTTAGDDRVRDDHAALEGTKLPKDDPFWQTFWPPNGWNCRCVALPIYSDSEEAVSRLPPTETEEGVPITPDDGFTFNPGTIVPPEAPPVLREGGVERIVSTPPRAQAVPQPTTRVNNDTARLIDQVTALLVTNDTLQKAASRLYELLDGGEIDEEELRVRLRKLVKPKRPRKVQ